MNLRKPWFTYFTDEELSKIASHLAAGGAFCCDHNQSWRAAVTTSKRKQSILRNHAYEDWGCWDGKYDFVWQGQGENIDHKYELERARRYFEKLEGDISGQRYWP